MIAEAWWEKTTLLAALLGATAGVLTGRWGARTLARTAVPAPISVPWAAAALGLLWTVAAVRTAAGVLPSEWTAVSLTLGLVLVLAGGADVAHHRLPDSVTLRAPPLLAVLLVLLAITQGEHAPVVRGLLGGVALTALYGLVHLVRPAALGAGDVKLAMTVGMSTAALSWSAWWVAAMVAPLLTAVAGLLRAVRRRVACEVPHGPSMLVPAWLLVTFATPAALVG